MPTARYFVRPLLLCCVALAGLVLGTGAGEKRGPLVAVRFHGETTEYEGSFAQAVKLPDGRQVFVERLPLISEANMIAFYPFAAANGTQGAAFQLDRHGTLALLNVSTAKRGSFLVAMVNGRVITPIQVDRQIEDGIVVLPFGLTPTEVALLDKSMPRIGQPPKKKSHDFD
ncbi:MAG: hypothetical protein JO117_09180 [Verrucomicrobia bacterium]|nr:hypothetical protein [Verrucomicrobiota bacterium]